MLVSSTTFIHKFMRFELIMRKFYPIIALMSIAMMTIISIPVEASETSWVVKSGQTKNFTGNYVNHSKNKSKKVFYFSVNLFWHKNL